MDIKYILYWLPMILIAFANATLRELVIVRYFNESLSGQLSTITLIVFCGIYIWLILPYLNILNSGEAFLIGIVWVVLTMAFEFTLGRLTNKSWAELFREYNLFAGNLWSLFLLCLFILPYLFYIIRNR